MAYGLPTYGEPGQTYTDKVNNSIEYVRALAEAAQADADALNTSVTTASETADQAKERAAAADAFVKGDSDTRVESLVKDPTSKTGTALSATYANIGGPQKALQLLDQIKRGKGGSIGTNGKGVIAFRYDHKVDPFRTTVWPLHVARGIPASLGIISRSIGNANAVYEPTTTTWAQVKSMMNNGLEVWSHSCTHSDPANVGTTFAEEIQQSKSEIEAQGIRVMGWQQPGNPATYGSNFFTPDSMDTLPGRLIRDTYGLYEASLTGTNRRSIPTNGCYGHDHVTLDTMTYTTAKTVVDQAAAMGIGVEFMLHSDVVDTAGHISLADLTSLLDYVRQQWDAGKIEVLTATGLAFADPGRSRRADLIQNGDFEGLSTATFGYGWTQNSSGTWTIGTDGGHTGSNYLRVPSAGTRAISSTAQIVNLGYDGHAFILDAWCRSVDVGGATARVRIRDTTTGTDVIILDKFDINLAQSTAWTHVRFPFVIPKGSSTMAFEVGRYSGGSVDWDDVHVYAV